MRGKRERQRRRRSQRVIVDVFGVKEEIDCVNHSSCEEEEKERKATFALRYVDRLRPSEKFSFSLCLPL